MSLLSASDARRCGRGILGKAIAAPSFASLSLLLGRRNRNSVTLGRCVLFLVAVFVVREVLIVAVLPSPRMKGHGVDDWMP